MIMIAIGLDSLAIQISTRAVPKIFNFAGYLCEKCRTEERGLLENYSWTDITYKYEHVFIT